MSEKPDFRTPSDFIPRCTLMAKGIFMATFETAESDFIVFSCKQWCQCQFFVTVVKYLVKCWKPLGQAEYVNIEHQFDEINTLAFDC